MESIKGFYKLRKAYITLNSILVAEARYTSGLTRGDVGSFKNRSVESFRSTESMTKGMPGGFGEDSPALPRSKASSLRSVRSVKSTNSKAGSLKGNGNDGFLNPNSKTENSTVEDFQDLSVQDDTALPSVSAFPAKSGMLTHDPSSDVFTDPIDVFVHSGANLCFGLLLLMISMIPPAFGRLLLIIGFRGDRERGLHMLWQASRFHNINGAMAGLILLGYYNTVIGFADIIPDSTLDPDGEDPVEGYPKAKCEELLKDMRTRHPKSHLWLLEEARMQSTNKNLGEALRLLQLNQNSPLKQVTAINMFETALDAAYVHDHTLCAESFIKCVDLNNWSHALYYFLAGACHVELYRKCKSSDLEAAKKHAEKATEYLRTAPKHAGKKKFMARQLPFDIFVVRKINKWEARAIEWNIPFIDAVGVSPAEELIFFANGFKRMDESQLRESLACLTWSENVSRNPTWEKESLDEKGILALLKATVIRNLGKWDEAKKLLKDGILKHNKADFKGGNRDDYIMPAANYEMGVICWEQRCDLLAAHESASSPPSTSRSPTTRSTVHNPTTNNPSTTTPNQPKQPAPSPTAIRISPPSPPSPTSPRPTSPPRTPKWQSIASRQDLLLEEEKLVKECEMWVEKAAKWEGYVLDTRIGLKVATAQDTLGKWRRRREEREGGGGV